MRLLIAILLFNSCASTSNEAHFEKSPNEKLADKRALYCQLSQAKFDQLGYAVSLCDGLLFTALRGIGCSNGVEKFESTVEPGRWYRDPQHACFDPDKIGEQGSDSTISKDMYVGLSAFLANKGDKETARRTVDYGSSRNWIVGEAKDAITLASKCFIVPELQNVFKKIAGQGSLAPDSDDSLGVSTGFRAHLDVIAILVRGKLNGSISTLDLTILKEQAKRQPRNALFKAAQARWDDGDFNPALEILFDESLFPEKSLPNNHQHYCTDYLFQRDDGDDWQKCETEPYAEHDGTDFIFASAIVGGAL
jgi:hypothetical protein